MQRRPSEKVLTAAELRYLRLKGTCWYRQTQTCKQVEVGMVICELITWAWTYWFMIRHHLVICTTCDRTIFGAEESTGLALW
jgi:hypothetical protein